MCGGRVALAARAGWLVHVWLVRPCTVYPRGVCVGVLVTITTRPRENDAVCNRSEANLFELFLVRWPRTRRQRRPFPMVPRTSPLSGTQRTRGPYNVRPTGHLSTYTLPLLPQPRCRFSPGSGSKEG